MGMADRTTNPGIIPNISKVSTLGIFAMAGTYRKSHLVG